MDSRHRGLVGGHTHRTTQRLQRLLAGACSMAILVASCGDGDDGAVGDEPAGSGDAAVTSPPPDVTPAPPPAPTSAPAATDPESFVETTEPAATTSEPEQVLVDRDAVERADPAVFDYEPVLPVEYEVISTHDFRGIEMQRITFDSPIGGTASAYLALPVSDPVDAGVLWGHGVPADGSDSWVPMSMFACAGVTSVVVEAPYARPETGRMGDPLLFSPQDRDEQIQLVVDMRRGLDLLTDLGATQLGFGGISYGASIGGLLLGVDQRPEAAVLVLGTGGIVERFTDESGAPSFPLSSRTDEEIQVWLEAMLPIEPIHFIGDSTADILFMNGDADDLIPPAEAERFHAASPAGAEVFWMDIGHDIPFEDMYRHNHWLGDRLGVDRERLDTCTDELFPNGWDDLG